MKALKGSRKQIKWAEDIRKQYIHFVEEFGGEMVDCEDAKFWIEYAQVSALNYEKVPTRLEAYEFLKRTGLRPKDFSDNCVWERVDAGELSEEAGSMIYQGEVR